jgi:CheY-like chemotaxis protein
MNAPLTVLVVDDERDTADSLGLLLRLWGHEAAIAYNVPAALELARACRPRVALLDLKLGGQSGIDLAKSLSREPGLAGLALIVLTGLQHEEEHRRARACGVQHILLKPVEPKALQTLLHALALPRHANHVQPPARTYA